MCQEGVKWVWLFHKGRHFVIPYGNGSYFLEKEGTWAVHSSELPTERLKMNYVEIVTGI